MGRRRESPDSYPAVHAGTGRARPVPQGASPAEAYGFVGFVLTGAYITTTTHDGWQILSMVLADLYDCFFSYGHSRGSQRHSPRAPHHSPLTFPCMANYPHDDLPPCFPSPQACCSSCTCSGRLFPTRRCETGSAFFTTPTSTGRLRCRFGCLCLGYTARGRTRGLI